MSCHRLSKFFIGDLRELLLECRWFCDLTQNGGVRTFRHAVHAADAILCDEFRNVGSDIAEVTERAGGGRNDAAGYLVVGFQAFFSGAVVVRPDYARVEVLGIDDVDPNVFREFFNRDIDSFMHFFVTP